MSDEKYSYWREGFRVGDYIVFRVVGMIGGGWYESRKYQGLILSREYLLEEVLYIWHEVRGGDVIGGE